MADLVDHLAICRVVVDPRVVGEVLELILDTLTQNLLLQLLFLDLLEPAGAQERGMAVQARVHITGVVLSLSGLSSPPRSVLALRGPRAFEDERLQKDVGRLTDLGEMGVIFRETDENFLSWRCHGAVMSGCQKNQSAQKCIF